jgi:membrane associated rhomboid family serine protease
MGFYDRDYQRGGGYYDRQPGFYLGGPRSMTTNLIIANVIVYFAQLLSGGENGWVTQYFMLHSDWYTRPWEAYQLLTYGFLHSPRDIWHILLNMFALWLFGREVESRYGRREYLAFYLIAIVVAGLVWSLAEIPNHSQRTLSHVVLGASGGVSAVVILFAMNFPYRTILFMFVIPMPMWVAAVIMVVMDAFGAVNRAGSTIAATAHLGGALFGFLYFQWGWRFERWLPSADLLERLKPKPKLRVHDPEEAENTEKAVDEILKKIQEHGRDSLTRRERKILEEASREYQKRRR